MKPVISILHQKSFIEELVLEAIPCLAKLAFAKEKKLKGEEGHIPGRGMPCTRDLWQVMIRIEIPTPTGKWRLSHN